MLEPFFKSFIEKIAQIKELCIVEAMAKGIDLHEMQIIENIETDENHIIRYTCKAIRRER